MSITCFVTIVFLIIAPETYSVSVEVKRAYHVSDVLEFSTTDQSICGRYNATFDYASGSFVHCKCTTTYPSFYSYSSSALPACHHSNAENLGCESCLSDCVSSINSATYSFGWTDDGDGFACLNGNGRYTIKKWDGKTWHYFYRTNDFVIEFRITTDATKIWFKWDRMYPTEDLKAYAGHLFLITAYCGTRKMHCFLAIADGTRTYSVADPPEKKAENKATKSSSSANVNIGIGVGVVVFIIFLIALVVLCKYFIKRKANKGLERNQQQPAMPQTQPIINNPFVVAPARPEQPPAYLSQPLQEFLHPPNYTDSSLTNQPPTSNTYNTNGAMKSSVDSTQIFKMQILSMNEY